MKNLKIDNDFTILITNWDKTKIKVKTRWDKKFKIYRIEVMLK